MKKGAYRGKQYIHNDLNSEIFVRSEKKESWIPVNGRYYASLNGSIKWESEHNSLASEAINNINGFNMDGSIK